MTIDKSDGLAIHRRLVPWVITTALFMETLDMTILNNAIPAIAHHIHEHPLNLKLALTSYLLSLGILIPISGALADKFGSKQILMLGVIVFGLGSLLCGLSSSLYGLVMARVLQGAGGALMMPVCRLILYKSYSKSEVVSVTNYSTIPALLGPALGPVIGGVIVTYFSWRWIFFINIPFCFILFYIIYKYTISFKDEAGSKIDIKSYIFFSIGFGIAIFTIEASSESFFSQSTSILLLSISACFIMLYFYLSRNDPNPFLDKRLFKSRTFTVTILGSLCSRLGIGGIVFLIPLLLQVSHNFSPIKSSFYVVFFAFAMICAKFFVKPLLKYVGFRTALVWNTVLIGVTIGGFSLIVDNSEPLLIICVIFLNGFFTSIQFSCMNVLTYIDLEDSLISKGTSIGSAVQQLSMSFGIAFLVFLLRTQNSNNNLIGQSSYNFTIYVLAIVIILSSLVFLKLDHDAGARASGHK